MKFMIIVKASTPSEAGAMPGPQLLEEMGQFNEALIKAGVMVDGAGLKSSSHGARVVFKDGGRAVEKPPFSTTEGIIAGYWIWKLNSLDEAIGWVMKCPHPSYDPTDIEIRQLFEESDFSDQVTI